MTWDDAEYTTPELVVIADRLNRCKDTKALLELELANQEFSQKYVTKRKKLTKEKVRTRMGFIIPVTLVLVVCIMVFADSVKDLKTYGYKSQFAMSILGSVLISIAVLYPFFRLWIPEIKMVLKLNRFNKNEDEDVGIVSYDTEAEKNARKIKIIREQLSDLNEEMRLLEARKKEQESIIESRKRYEEELEALASDGKFKLHKDKMSNIHADELMDFYEREIKEYKEEKVALEREDVALHKKHLDIQEDFMMVKKRIIVFLFVVATLALVQNIFPGILYQIVGIVIGVYVIGYFIYLATACEKIIILYLVEKESKIIEDYAFIKGLVPTSKRRKEITLDLATCNNRIKEYEMKKQELQQEIDRFKETVEW